MIARLTASFLILSAAGCGELPRDTAGTSERVRAGTMRVGEVGGAEHSRLEALLARLAEQTGPQVSIASGAAEPLLMRLEAGELDLIVGEFDQKTPWSKRVTFSKPLASTKGRHGTEEVKAATRNGEHRWAMEVDRAVARSKQ